MKYEQTSPNIKVPGSRLLDHGGFGVLFNNEIFMSDTYILEGKTPIRVDFMTWAQWSGNDGKEKIVEQTSFPNEVLVSTVFLGLDHRMLGDTGPVLFETMVFGGEHDGFQERYQTWDEAAEGHKRALKMIFD